VSVPGFVGLRSYSPGMRLLHTSDWHLGRSLHREDLLGAQAAYIDHLVDVVREEAVDVVLVAGDVYDRALPGVEAVKLCNEALGRLAATGVRVVLISGNHDSARRLGFAADLIDASGVHLRTDPADVGKPVMLADRHGPVAIYPIPYLEPDAVASALGCDERGHAAAVSAAMARVRADLATRAAGTRSVAMAHIFATGGEPSESERDIVVGGLATVPTSVFVGLDYAALGHLHGPQRLAEHVRYSGSPLPYSFSEARHHKSSWLVELGAEGLERVEAIATPVYRPLAKLRGRLTELLTDAGLARHEGSFLSITLTDSTRPADPMRALRTRFPYALMLAFEPDGQADLGEEGYLRRLRGRSDLQIATGFVEFVRERAVDEWERTLLREAVHHAARERDTGAA
jgi:exonuclease SbcD